MTRRTADEWQQWVDEFAQGESVEAWRGVMCFLRWIQIRADNGHPIPNFLPAMEGDIFHSYLLRRMLAGKEPLAAPPPESDGQPWYDLVETGKGTSANVKPWEWAPDQKISINEGIWTIVEKVSDAEYVITYRLSAGNFRLTKQAGDVWLIERII